MWKIWGKTVGYSLGYSLLIMKKMWGYFQLDNKKNLGENVGFFFVDNLENLREKLQYFLLIMWKTWGKKVGYVEPEVG